MLFIANSVAIKTSWFRGVQIATNVFAITAPSLIEARKAAEENTLKVFPRADGYKNHCTSVHDAEVMLKSHFDKVMASAHLPDVDVMLFL